MSFLSKVIYTAGVNSASIHDKILFDQYRRMANTVEGRGVDAPVDRLPVAPGLTLWGRTGTTTTFALGAGTFEVDEHGTLHGDSFTCPIVPIGAPRPPDATHLLIEVHPTELHLRYVLGDDGAPVVSLPESRTREAPSEASSLQAWEGPRFLPTVAPRAERGFVKILKQIATWSALAAAAWLAYAMGRVEDMRNVPALRDAAQAAAETLSEAESK